MYGSDCLHVIWCMRPGMMRRHCATDFDFAQVIAGFEQGHANGLGEDGSIAALIADGIFFDHRQAMKGRRAASGGACDDRGIRSEEHTSELQSLMRISYSVFCLKKKTP